MKKADIATLTLTSEDGDSISMYGQIENIFEDGSIDFIWMADGQFQAARRLKASVIEADEEVVDLIEPKPVKTKRRK